MSCFAGRRLLNRKKIRNCLDKPLGSRNPIDGDLPCEPSEAPIVKKHLEVLERRKPHGSNRVASFVNCGPHSGQRLCPSNAALFHNCLYRTVLKRAGDAIRTRDIQLGKLALYH